MIIVGCQSNTQEAQLETLIADHVAVVQPLSAQMGRISWQAEITGEPKYFEQLKQLRLQMTDIYSNPETFEFLQETRDSGNIDDPVLKRQLDRLYFAFLKSKVPQDLKEQMIELSTATTEMYNKFRGTIDGAPVTMSEIYSLMTTQGNTPKRKKAWQASKQVGTAIEQDLLKLVKLRNRTARLLGYDNWHTMAMQTDEQDVAQLDLMFYQLYELTNEPYAELKAELDGILAANYGIKVDQLRPWHYHDPFFQRTPLVYELDLDSYYKNHDVKLISEKYFAGVGLPVDDILARSDLYDKPGKNPHAFAQDMDSLGDVRILCNLNNDERWMETILHELGHAVYAKYHDRQVPYLLRTPAHAFTTEAIAMFFGRLSRNPAWMQQMLELSDQQTGEIKEVVDKYLTFQQVLFARWAMVMYNFEKALYANPDQDLNTLWWDLVEKYQYVNRPDGKPDAGWASKLHFTVAPCYYHNYMMGELFASQLHDYIIANILKLESDANVSYVNTPQVGKYIEENVLAPSATYHWNDMIERATGRPLTPEYFVKQFID